MLKVFCDRHHYNALYECLASIRRDDTTTHIVITPDRVNQNIQNVIFDILGTQVLFDVDVTTLSRYVNRNLADMGLDHMVLSKTGAVAIVSSIMEDEEANLASFAHSRSSAQTIYDTIAQLKSCNITPKDLDTEVSSAILSQKLADLKLIYTKYEEYLSHDFTDSFNRLHLFAKSINRLDLSHTKFYFVGFEDFTSLNFEIIFALAKYASSVSVSCVYDPKRSYCPNFVYGNLEYFARIFGEKIERIGCKNRLSATATYMLDHFEDKETKPVAGPIKISYAINSVDEIEYVARTIRKQVLSGKRYLDFTILCCGLSEYKDDIKKIFDTYEIPYFLDNHIDVNNISAINFISSILDCLSQGLNYIEVMRLLASPYMHFDQNLLHDIDNKCVEFGLKYNITDSKILADYPEFLNALAPIKELVDTKQSTYSVYCEALRNILLNLDYEGTINSESARYITVQDYESARVLGQVYSKIMTALDELVKVLGDRQTSLESFIDVARSVIETLSISLPPTVIDSVFVGDISTSYILGAKNLFILGANEGNLPKYQMDMGIISDVDIDRLPFGSRITPSIAMLNKRSKFRALSTFALGQNLELTYHTSSVSGSVEPSSMLKILNRIFDITPYNISKDLYDLASADGVISANLSKKKMENNFATNLSTNAGGSAYQDMLGNLLGAQGQMLVDEAKSDVSDSIQNAKDIYFVTHSSVSEYETFARCPYLHFLNYGLRLRERKVSKIDSRIIGTIIHEFVQKWVGLVVKYDHIDDLDVSVYATNILDSILKKTDYATFVDSPSNKVQLLSLKREVISLARLLLEQLSHTGFRPTAKTLEYRFSSKIGTDIKINIPDRVVSLEGVIDRVDTWDKYFRIIDYKTGSDSFSYSDVLSGKKLQLLVYLRAYANLSGLLPAGAFYMPIKDDYADDGKGSVRGTLDGFMLNDVDVARLQDDTINVTDKGRYIGARLKGKGESFNGKYMKNKLIDADEIEALLDFSMKKLEEESSDILSGICDHTPLGDKENDKSMCAYCKYRGICKKVLPKVYPRASSVDDILGRVDSEQ